MFLFKHILLDSPPQTIAYYLSILGWTPIPPYIFTFFEAFPYNQSTK